MPTLSGNEEFTGLLIPDEKIKSEVESSLSVCADIRLSDIPNWQDLLIPENSPHQWGLQFERQNRNDCQANCGTTCMEVIEFRTKRKRAELARMFFYQQSEVFDGSLGRDRGTTIHAGIRVMRELGCPTEKDYPYNRYTGSKRQLNSWSNPLLSDAGSRRIEHASPAPEFEVMLANILLGRPLHWGTFWPIELNSQRICRRYRGRHGGGGHAYAGVWVKVIRGEPLIEFFNSHGDPPLYFSEQAYEEARQSSPFGAFCVAGTEQPKLDFWLI